MASDSERHSLDQTRACRCSCTGNRGCSKPPQLQYRGRGRPLQDVSPVLHRWRKDLLLLLLWKLWSPSWAFDQDIYRRTAKSFDNPDFVDVVIHSYKHRIRNAAGDPRYAPIEARLAALPRIGVSTIVIHGADDEVNPVQKSEGHQRFFTGHYERRVFDNVGHNPPQEAPEQFARAVLDLCRRK